MAKVNGVPGFTNFKKVNILDTFLIKGQPISGGGADPTQPVNVTGGWTFSTNPTTFESNLDIKYQNKITIEDSTTAVLDALQINASDEMQFGDIDQVTKIVGFSNLVTLGGDTTANPKGALQIEGSTSNILTQIGFTEGDTGTLAITNLLTNQNIDLKTTGTGQVLVNGSPIGGGLTNPLANNEFLQGQDTPGGVAQNLIGVNTSNITELGDIDLAGMVARTGTGSYLDIWASGSRGIRVFNQTGATEQWAIQTSGNDLVFNNSLSNGNLRIQAGAGSSGVIIEDSNGTDRIDVNNGGRIVFFDTSGSSAFQSQDYLGASATAGLQIRGDGGLKDAGYNQINPATFSTTANFISKGNINRFYKYTGTGGDTVNFNTSGVSPFGHMWMFRNGGTGTFTINPAARTLEWYDGSSVQTGTRTIAVGGVCTIVSIASNEFVIYGNGIT